MEGEVNSLMNFREVSENFRSLGSKYEWNLIRDRLLAISVVHLAILWSTVMHPAAIPFQYYTNAMDSLPRVRRQDHWRHDEDGWFIVPIGTSPCCVDEIGFHYPFLSLFFTCNLFFARFGSVNEWIPPVWSDVSITGRGFPPVFSLNFLTSSFLSLFIFWILASSILNFFCRWSKGKKRNLRE